MGLKPRGFARTAELDALFARGFPELFVLGDGPADIDLVREALDDIDPRLPVFISRATAERFLHGYTIRAIYRLVRGEVRTIKKRAAERERLLAASDPADDALMAKILDQQLPHGDETYSWRVVQAIYLFEALLGTATVAAALVDRLARALADVESWGFWGDDPERANTHACAAAIALSTMRLRMNGARWRRLVAPLRGADNPRLAVYSRLLAAVADDRLAPPRDAFAADLAIARHDAEALRGVLDRYPKLWPTPQALYLLGPGYLADRDLGDPLGMPRWWQERFLVEYGAIRHPEIARIAARIRRRGERISEGQVRAGLDRLFAALPGQLAAAGSEAAEREIFAAAYAEYRLLRAATGDPSPGAFFMHSLPRLEARWVDLALEVVQG